MDTTRRPHGSVAASAHARAAAGAPLAWDELRNALALDDARASVPIACAAGLVIECAGAPLGTDAIAERLRAAGAEWERAWRDACGRPRLGPIGRGASGAWTVDARAPELARARDALRDALARERARAERESQWRAARERRTADQRARDERWQALAKCIVRSVWDQRRLVAACVLDVDARTFEPVRDRDALREAIERRDAVLGLDPCADLALLDLDPSAREVVDLRPPTTMRRLGAQRVLWITPELVLRGTLRRAGTLRDPRELALLARRGDLRALQHRLAEDARALHALHAYGRLHGYVRLRFGFLDEQLAVPWSAPPSHTLPAVLARAAREARAVELVLHAPPPWSGPWSRAEAYDVRGVADGRAELVSRRRGETASVALADVYAVRALG